MTRKKNRGKTGKNTKVEESVKVNVDVEKEQSEGDNKVKNESKIDEKIQGLIISKAESSEESVKINKTDLEPNNNVTTGAIEPLVNIEKLENVLEEKDREKNDRVEVVKEPLVKDDQPSEEPKDESRKEKNKCVGNEQSSVCSLCQSPSARPCKRCGILLCGTCYPLHLYKARCLPWKVRNGFLVATRDIKPLEVVLCDRAIVTVPTGKVSCMGCGRSVNCQYNCPKCSLPLCGTQCPRADSHSVECSILCGRHTSPPISEEDKGHPLYSAVAVLRIVNLMRNRKEDWALVSELPCQVDRVRSDPLSKELLHQVEKILDGLGYEIKEIEHAFCLLKLYGYNLPDQPDGKVRSLFPLQSRLSHSCLPSLQYIEKEGGRTIVLQAVTGISRGEKFTVRFTPFLQGRIGVTRWLREQRFVSCSCARCKDGTDLGTFTSSALCDLETCRDQGGLLLPVDPQFVGTDWICSSCQTISSSASVESLEESYVAAFQSLPQGDLTAYYRFLNQLGDRFHASHHLVMRMAQFLVLLQGKKLESLSIERIQTQSILCDKLISYVSRLDPGATQTRARLLLEKNKADLNLAKIDCENGKISRKVFMQKIKEGVKVEVNAKKILYFKWEE